MGSLGERDIVITKWDILSSAGVGKRAFRQRFEPDSKRAPLMRSEPDSERDSGVRGHVLEGVSLNELIGPKGTKHMDRTTMLAIAASGLVLDGVENRERIGIVLGTTFGSLKSISDFGCETLTAERPYLVNPLHFPNTVMNCAASQAAIRHQCRGLNATVSGGHLASLNALHYARTALDLGYADALLAGGVEEWSVKFARGFGLAECPGIPGEGCAMFLLETAASARTHGRKPEARLIACETAMCGGATEEETAHTIRSFLSREVRPHVGKGRPLICFPGTGPGADKWERQTIGELGSLGLEVQVADVCPSDLFGDCYSASAAFQLAACLSLPQPGSERHYALVTSSSRSGMFGFALLEVWPPDENVHDT